MKPLTAQRLRELLYYDPLTGVFTWRQARCNRGAGTVAGSLRGDGYLTIRLDKRPYRSTHLAHLYMTGEWPAHLIDYEDRDKTNTRWANLRPATYSEIHQGQKLRKDSTHGLRGIERHERGLWRARLTVGGRRIHLGYFKTPEAAAAARREGERIHFTHSPACRPQA
jgi:hypothetical protein